MKNKYSFADKMNPGKGAEQKKKSLSLDNWEEWEEWKAAEKAEKKLQMAEEKAAAAQEKKQNAAKDSVKNGRKEERKTEAAAEKDKKAEHGKAADRKKDSRRRERPVTDGRQKASDGKQKVKEAGAGRKCPYAKKCGGCEYQGVPYEEQLQQKWQQVRKLMEPFGKPEAVRGMKDPYHYRNKVHAAFAYEKGNIYSGVYEEKSHRVVNVDSCQIEDETADAIIYDIRNLCKSFKIRIYDEDTGYGLLRHVMVRRGYHSKETMVVLVLTSPVFPSKNNFVKALLKLHPEINTIILNINERQTSMVLGERNIVLYGKGYITDTLCGVKFRISPRSFYQINTSQTEVLYGLAMEMAGLAEAKKQGRSLSVIDAYCGIGTIGLIAAADAGQVIGVETNADAVKDAVVNAKENKTENIRFYCQDAGEFMTDLATQGEKVDVVFMDPPRAGSDEAFLKSVAALKPKKVVYISCFPETLARDLKYMKKNGYEVKRIVPVDMFPFTEHVETVVLLSKGDIDSTRVRVEFPLDELEITGLRGKATYEQIKAYVKEQTGLKVSSLYISQIKRACGLEVGDNYHISKKEDARIPQCPSEKEKAIREAFRHFGMI